MSLTNGNLANLFRLITVGLAGILVTVFWNWSNGLDAKIELIDSKLDTLVVIQTKVTTLCNMHELNSKNHLPEIIPHDVLNLIDMHNGKIRHPFLLSDNN